MDVRELEKAWPEAHATHAISDSELVRIAAQARDVEHAQHIWEHSHAWQDANHVTIAASNHAERALKQELWTELFECAQKHSVNSDRFNVVFESVKRRWPHNGQTI